MVAAVTQVYKRKNLTRGRPSRSRLAGAASDRLGTRGGSLPKERPPARRTTPKRRLCSRARGPLASPLLCCDVEGAVGGRL